MVVLDSEVGSERIDHRRLPGEGRLRPPPWALTTGILLVVAVVLGTLGWVLPEPAESLIIPTLIVLGVGLAISVAFWVVVGRTAPTLAVVAITLAATVWAFAFSLPASLAWNAGATAQAQAALARLAVSPKSAVGIPLHPCSTVTTGSVGKLHAPYRVCAVSSPEGHIVTFSRLTSPPSGLGYTDRDAAASFPDECTRHLVGKWWMFINDASGSGACPIGYHDSGAG